MQTEITEEGWMVIENDTHLAKWIKDSKRLDHDEFLIPIACNNMPEGGIVMDCGAMYGDHTIAYAKKVGPTGSVIAIEAGALAYKCLLHNAKKFESETICIQGALCQQHGGKAIHHVQEGNLGMSIVTEDESKGVEIRTLSIDGIVKDGNLNRLDFIKIDCEGWEAKILRGAIGTLKTLKPILLIEINSFALSEQGDSEKDIYDLLLDVNYAWRIVQPDCKGGDPIFDIMAWPNQVQTLSKDLIK